jgi:ketopantoate reductase
MFKRLGLSPENVNGILHIIIKTTITTNNNCQTDIIVVDLKMHQNRMVLAQRLTYIPSAQNRNHTNKSM